LDTPATQVCPAVVVVSSAGSAPEEPTATQAEVPEQVTSWGFCEPGGELPTAQAEPPLVVVRDTAAVPMVGPTAMQSLAVAHATDLTVEVPLGPSCSFQVVPPSVLT